MINYLLLALVILLYSFQTLFCVFYSANYKGPKGLASGVFNVLEALAVILISLIRSGFRLPTEPLTWILGILNGAALLGYNLSLMKGTPLGSYAFINISLLFGGLIGPIIFSVIALGEKVSGLQIFAILLMLASFVIYNGDGLREKKHYPRLFYLSCILIFLFNSAYAIIVKAQSSYCDQESIQMIAITNVFMGAISLVMLIRKTRTPKTFFAAFRMNRRALIPLILCLCSAAAAIMLLLYVMARIPAPVFYPVEHGGIIFLSALFSFLIFKEKVTPLKLAGLAAAAVSMIILCL